MFVSIDRAQSIDNVHSNQTYTTKKIELSSTKKTVERTVILIISKCKYQYYNIHTFRIYLL